MTQKEVLGSIILAAGKGTRMNSPLPKVLHPVAGRPMLSWVIDAVQGAGVQKICLILGGELELFRDILNSQAGRITVAEQQERRGTGDAVASAAGSIQGVVKPPYFKGRHVSGEPFSCDWVLICTGDAPNLRANTLQKFTEFANSQSADLAVIGMIHPNPYGYGRLVQDSSGDLVKIVEEKDADDELRKINVCNSGVILARTKILFELLAQVKPVNRQNEYYLTDIFGLARKDGLKTAVFKTPSWQEFEGINDPIQLKRVEELILAR
jgi:bifunctional UDP-N-acetylglucosamine pyrophosphorylase/glucosamine-1-phosphate N-acetyltransferase